MQDTDFIDGFVQRLVQAQVVRPINYHAPTIEAQMKPRQAEAKFISPTSAPKAKADQPKLPPPQESREFELKVKVLKKNTEVVIKVQTTDTILQLKEKIEGATAAPVNTQRLILKGKALVNGKKVSDYELSGGTTIHLLEKAPEAEDKERVVKDFYVELEAFLRETLTEEQTKKIILKLQLEYKKTVDSWNVEDIAEIASQLP